PQTVHAMQMLRAALEQVDFGGGEIDVSRIALALEDASIETPVGPISIRAEDHQAVLPVVVSKVVENPEHPADGTNLGFAVVKVNPGEDIMYPVQDSCSMDRPS